MNLFCSECEEMFDSEEYEYIIETTNGECPFCGAIDKVYELVELTCLECGEVWEGSVLEPCPSCNSLEVEEIT